MECILELIYQALHYHDVENANSFMNISLQKELTYLMINLSSTNDETWIPLHLREKLSFVHILGIACGNLAPQLMWIVIPLLFEPLAAKLKVPSIVITFSLLYGSFSGFVVAPILGVYSDSSMCRWGRRRIFLVVGLIVLILGVLMMMYCEAIGKFLSPSNPHLCQQIIYIISYFVSVTAGNIVQAPARTICSDVCPPHQQNLMSNICSVFSGSGGIVVNIIGALKLYKYTPLGQEQFILILSVVLCVASIGITVIVTPEESIKIKPPRVRPFKQIWTSIRAMPKPYVRCTISLLLAQIAYFQLSFQFSHFMGQDIFGGDAASKDPAEREKYDSGLSWAMMCGAMRCGAQFIFGFVNTFITEKIGFKATSVITYFLMAVGLMLFFWVNNHYAYLGIVILIGIGHGAILAIPYAIVSLCTPIHDFGANLGILMMVTVIGEQLSNFGIGSGFGAIWPNNPRYIIGISCIFGYLASLSSFLIIEPIIDKDGYASISDVQTIG